MIQKILLDFQSFNRFFLTSKGQDWLLFNVYKGTHSPEVQRPDRAAFSGPPSNVEFKKVWNYNSISTRSGRLRHNFVFVIKRKCTDKPEFFSSLSLTNLVIGFPSLCKERNCICTW